MTDSRTAVSYSFDPLERTLKVVGDGLQERFENTAKSGDLVPMAKQAYVTGELPLRKFEPFVAHCLVAEDHFGDHWGFHEEAGQA